MRKGELCGLLKSDVDLEGRTLTVARSYDKPSTKGLHADVLPIADPLMPYLKDAIDRSPSKWVFPVADGSMRSGASKPEKILRSALTSAGLFDGWEHVCRRCTAAGRPAAEQRSATQTATCAAARTSALRASAA